MYIADLLELVHDANDLNRLLRENNIRAIGEYFTYIFFLEKISQYVWNNCHKKTQI